jgi:hypothetical protein
MHDSVMDRDRQTHGEHNAPLVGKRFESIPAMSLSDADG